VRRFQGILSVLLLVVLVEDRNRKTHPEVELAQNFKIHLIFYVVL